jgi:DNA-binding transcriptional MerR regulator/methylmalonyl-CoA mutase cobalamin-binding subunit
MSYRIKTVEKLTGISRNTITAWERRYSLIQPTRDASGYRAYSEEDIARLRRVKGLIDQGYQIGEVLTMLAETAPPKVDDTERLVEELRTRLLDVDREGAQRVVRQMRHLAAADQLEHVYSPVMREIGELWEDGKASIGQEHFATAFVRDQLLQSLRDLDQGPRRGTPAICAGFPGEDHELGLLTVAIHLALEGHRVTYLGANMPAEDLAQLMIDQPARVVCSSLLLPRPAREIIEWAHHIRDHTAPHVVIAIGGPGVAHLSEQSEERVRFVTSFRQLADILSVRP